MALEKSTKIPADLVIAAYRTFLNREPESEEAIRNHTEKHRSAENLLGAFLNCEEFRNKASKRYGDHMVRVAAGYRQQLNHIDVNVSSEDFSRIFARIKDQWTALGKSEPYWSVLTNDRFRMSSIQKTKGDFYASGAGSDKLVDIFCQRTDVVRPSGVCLELGCGVGRVTGFLAKRFDHVIAFDISQGNFDIAREHLSEWGYETSIWCCCVILPI